MKITLPLDFQDITLEQYQKYHSGISDIELLKLFWKGDVSKVSLNALETAKNHLNELFSNEDARFFKSFTFEDIEYGFVNDWNEFTTGEWIDCETYGQNLRDAHKLMSILYRPITRRTDKWYEIEPYNGSHEMFKDLPASWYLGMTVFFCEREKELLTSSAQSLMGMVEKLTSSRKGGDGITP